MSSADAVLWLVACFLAIALGGALWRRARNAAARRARHLRYQSHESRPHALVTRPGGLSGSMTRERAASIRRSAEGAALLAVRGQAGPPKNPYPEGSPEFVLWVATYHLTVTELSEHADTVDPAASGGIVSRP
jgi:hypothetical protein